MKIAMLYANWEATGEPWSTPQGIRNELLTRGHEVKVYNLYHNDGELHPKRKIRHYSNDGLNRLNADIQGAFFRPELVLVMDYGPWQSPLLNPQNFPNMILLKETGDEPQAHRMHSQTARCFHALLSPDYQCVERYREAGMKAIWWTHHADTSIFYPRPGTEQRWDCVTTCGSRGRGLTDKIKAELGDQFENSRYFHGNAHGERLNMGRMVFQCSQFGEITRRIFEGMACGKMVITDRLSEATHIGDIFTEGEDIVYYDNPEDAIDKIRYYASHDAEREAIAMNGLAKVLEDHTTSARVDQLEDLVEDLKRERMS